MGIFQQKKKTCDVIFIEENIIIVGKERYHRHDHEFQEIKQSLSLIIKTLNKMGENIQALKADLVAANAKVDRVATDVAKLLGIIAGSAGETPTAAEWAEVKELGASLNNKLQGLDDQVPED